MFKGSPTTSSSSNSLINPAFVKKKKNYVFFQCTLIFLYEQPKKKTRQDWKMLLVNEKKLQLMLHTF